MGNLPHEGSTAIPLMDYHGESGEGVPREMVETKSYALFVTHGGRRIPILCNGEDRGPYPSQENPMCYYGNVKELGKMVEGHLKRIRVTHNTDMDRLVRKSYSNTSTDHV